MYLFHLQGGPYEWIIEQKAEEEEQRRIIRFLIRIIIVTMSLKNQKTSK